jgi:hypothetical protein
MSDKVTLKKGHKTVELPNYPKSQVTIPERLTLKDIKDNTSSVADIGTENMGEILSKIITDWNFYDEDDNKLPINEENIDKLYMEDINFLVQEVVNQKNAEKKG